jgi:hypothetical protein
MVNNGQQDFGAVAHSGQSNFVRWHTAAFGFRRRKFRSAFKTAEVHPPFQQFCQTLQSAPRLLNTVRAASEGCFTYFIKALTATLTTLTEYFRGDILEKVEKSSRVIVI